MRNRPTLCNPAARRMCCSGLVGRISSHVQGPLGARIVLLEPRRPLPATYPTNHAATHRLTHSSGNYNLPPARHPTLLLRTKFAPESARAIPATQCAVTSDRERTVRPLTIANFDYEPPPSTQHAYHALSRNVCDTPRASHPRQQEHGFYQLLVKSSLH
ncbi:hypothetical protein HBI56_226680 [Parastagonospora nodorum]|uniref:Uncharacterized protein n=1 Tax=Phaeosphaeria nodorum (strain SN15 / ATCC MYA-4574 / FGSC 10173) TaxID=321614 RepID=A0A7U2HYV4_PHANO|nr:hypothetical protein HBH56_226860 [Parastagonospora nodorum]QRC95728.1 hypothetical protein JI435_407860 [Parastagonospora nodorum SN15]KAH3921754.1 hypothetical protein HBH54_235950 [Parastagonospora nodorum]KAH3959083.1 hypothetical protein HBH51_202740 [Parastagonospora nodorum]KAH3963586.1 hypothetical protein HBH52_216810 [Parastagonospora nodorum]